MKKAASEFVAQKATELGVSELRPIVTRRTIVSRVNVDRMLANAIEGQTDIARGVDAPIYDIAPSGVGLRRPAVAHLAIADRHVGVPAAWWKTLVRGAAPLRAKGAFALALAGWRGGRRR